MNDSTTTLEELKKSIYAFVEERDWVQYNNPKNMSMALAIEVAELMEFFQWVEGVDSVRKLEKHREAIEHEIADIANYLFTFCAIHNIDLAQAIERKRKELAVRYPVEKVKGRFTKYADDKL